MRHSSSVWDTWILVNGENWEFFFSTSRAVSIMIKVRSTILNLIILCLFLPLVFFSCEQKKHRPVFKKTHLQTLPFHQNLWQIPPGANVSWDKMTLEVTSEMKLHALQSTALTPSQSRVPLSMLVSCRLISAAPYRAGLCLSLGEKRHVCSRFAVPGEKEQVYSAFIPPSYISSTPSSLKILTYFDERPGKLSSCRILQVEDTKYQDPPKPFRSHFHFAPHSRRKVLFLGGSTMVDNGGEFAFPRIFELLMESYQPGKYSILNLATWSATLIDHLYNWDQIQVTEGDRPFLATTSYDGFDLERPMAGHLYYPKTQSLPYGIRDLAPDTIVLAPMWNDFFIRLFLKGGSVPYLQEKSLPLLHYQALLNFAREGEVKQKELERVSGQMAQWVTTETLSESGHRIHPSHKAMYDTYYFLYKDLVHKIRKDLPQSKLIFLTLPFEINGHSKSSVIEFKMKQSLNLKHYGPYGLNLGFWTTVEEIQVQVAQRLANEFSRSWVFDLSGYYHSLVQGLSPKEFHDQGIFGDDLMHLGIRGNHMVADKLFEFFVEKGL